jgi:DNA-binding MarR family transcriptional regulator
MTRTIPTRQHAVNGRATSPTRTPAGSAFSVFVVRVFQIHGLLIEAGNKLARPAGQTSARWQILAAIDDRPATVSGIARALSLARQSVQRLADVLEREGLVLFEDNPHHHRAKLLRLTRHGRAALKAIQGRQRPWADALGAQIGEDSLRAVNEQLTRIFGALAPTEVA